MAGRVVKTLAERFWRKVVKTSTCWLWTGAIKKDSGYGVIGETRTGKMLYVHIVSWKLAGRKLPRRKKVLHRCDVRNCIRPSHLFSGTNADNTRDMYEKGRAPIGERHGMAVLTESEVIEIRRLYSAGGVTQYELAEDFEVSQATVCMVVTRKHWSHV